MKQNSLNFTIAPLIVVPVLLAALVVTGFVEWNSLIAKEDRDNPKRVLNLASCTKCHSDEKMLKKMRWKEGSTHFLFDDKPNVCPIKPKSAKNYDPAVSNWIKQSPLATK